VHRLGNCFVITAINHDGDAFINQIRGSTGVLGVGCGVGVPCDPEADGTTKQRVKDD
jgi:hypothetical protein